ncbi:hypothetical protein [Neobacillus terrae]|uniref:hypothetical protein n=1 Tax=Neobacillus terrae TaxID=3034837 RepID=UPI00140BE260|nr:hypothetical protein [Neobacillus terrae]NHM32107.1 hypothetical protein [Neobacillus terrae]
MFVAVGITLTAMMGMLHAKKVDDLKVWSSLAVKVDGLLPLSVIFILVPGLYLVFSTWGWKIAWVNISLAALIVMTIMGPAINLRKLKGILNAVKSETESTPSAGLQEKVRNRVLWNSVIIMTMLTIAILFLMVVKPALVWAFLTIAAAILLGVITAGLILRSSVNTSISKESNSSVNI